MVCIVHSRLTLAILSCRFFSGLFYFGQLGRWPAATGSQWKGNYIYVRNAVIYTGAWGIFLYWHWDFEWHIIVEGWDFHWPSTLYKNWSWGIVWARFLLLILFCFSVDLAHLFSPLTVYLHLTTCITSMSHFLPKHLFFWQNDAYLRVYLGKERLVNDKDDYIPNTLDPLFGK